MIKKLVGSRLRIGAGAALAFAIIFAIVTSAPRAFSRPPDATTDAALIEGYRHVEVASVSDAMEKLTGQRIFLTHRMRPIFTSKFAGFALTVKLKKEENKDPDALSGMLAAIDQGGANSVYVMVVEDGADIAGMGGLMGTAMQARNFSGAVIDGGVLDKSAFPCSRWEQFRPHQWGIIVLQAPIFRWCVMVFQ